LILLLQSDIALDIFSRISSVIISTLDQGAGVLGSELADNIAAYSCDNRLTVWASHGVNVTHWFDIHAAKSISSMPTLPPMPIGLEGPTSKSISMR
jgi:hypothetical protein